jgi:hypothetical protein
MSDGEPNQGKVSSDLIEFAESIRDPDSDGDDEVLIFTLGFNENASGQSLLRSIASEGCFISVNDATDLEGFFTDMADMLNGQKYIYIRVACPVDVTITYNGETLTSSAEDENTRTSFGTITYEEDENASSSDDPIKVIRLKEGTEYDIQINGTGTGTMDYSMSLANDDGKYTDTRTFSNLEITNDTIITSIASPSEETTLSVDEDGDGVVDKTYKAASNAEGELVDNSWVVEIVFASFAVLAVLIFMIVLIRSVKKSLKKSNSQVWR